MKKTLNYDLKTEESRRTFIQNEESSLYGAVDEDGNRVAVKLQKGIGMEISTFQSNGWTRVAEYDANGYFVGETYEK